MPTTVIRLRSTFYSMMKQTIGRFHPQPAIHQTSTDALSHLPPIAVTTPDTIGNNQQGE